MTKRLRYLSLTLLAPGVATFLVLRFFSPIVPYASTGDSGSLWSQLLRLR
ncbi:MAG: hypothetical protein WBF73_20910 [Bradyrhizobium sp.]